MVPRLQQRQLKQQNMVLEESVSSLVLEGSAFLEGLVQFLGLEASQGLGLLLRLLLQRQPRRQPSMERLEA